MSMLFVVFDVRTLLSGPLHEESSVWVQQVSRAAENNETADASYVAEEGVEDGVFSVIANPQLGEQKLPILDEPGIQRLDFIDLWILHPHVQCRGDEEGEVDRVPALRQ